MYKCTGRGGSVLKRYLLLSPFCVLLGREPCVAVRVCAHVKLREKAAQNACLIK